MTTSPNSNVSPFSAYGAINYDASKGYVVSVLAVSSGSADTTVFIVAGDKILAYSRVAKTMTVRVLQIKK